MTALLGDGPAHAPAHKVAAGDGSGELAPMRRFAGMRTRVLISFLVLLTLSTAASVLVLREVLLSRIDDEVAQALATDITELQELSAGRVDPATDQPFKGRVDRIFDAYLTSHSPLADSATVAWVEGQPYAEQSAGAELEPLLAALREVGPVTEPDEGTIETDLGAARFAAVPIATAASTGSLVIGQLLVDRREQVGSAVRIAVGVSIVVLLLASLFIWLAAGRAMAPLQALARSARMISETDLSRRIAVGGNDEIAELGRTLNAMLDRLETAFADQREFLADVSHELRTPITVIRGHIETLGDDPRDRGEAVMVIQDELDRMNRFVDDLLLLVRASRPDFLRPEPLDLDLLTHETFAKSRLLGDRVWVLEGTGIGLLVADAQRLTQAITNLASNAVNHTGPGEPIWIGSALKAREARIWVRDEGPGIPAEEQRLIFERFARSQSVRGSGGAGLGLAIVEAIAQAHGGRVELDSALGAGAKFTIVIPVE
ncbi:MAG: sensor histidine kinase [Solirubrobacterales bacterium]